MGDLIRVKTTVIPIEELTDENAGTHGHIAGEVGKILSGWGEVAITDYGQAAPVQGQKDGSPYYVQVDDSAAVAVSTESAAKFVAFKNTGKTYVSSSALGAVLDKSIKVFFNSNAIALIPAGHVWTIPYLPGLNLNTDFELRTCDNDGSNNSSAGHLALEMLVVK